MFRQPEELGLEMEILGGGPPWWGQTILLRVQRIADGYAALARGPLVPLEFSLAGAGGWMEHAGDTGRVDAVKGPLLATRGDNAGGS